MRTIGTELKRLDMHTPALVGYVLHASSLREMLTFGPDERFSLQGVTLTTQEGLAYAAHCLRTKGHPFIADDGELKIIVREGAKALHKRLSEESNPDLPALLRAVEARIRRLDAAEALRSAIDEEAGALLALAA